jgi:putative hydrolase of the HAD superfamily
MASAAGVGRDVFEQAYWKHRRAYDLGWPASDYWSATLAELGSVRRELVDRMIELDVASWTRYREAVWEIAARARTAGCRTAILSNGVPEVMARVRRERDLASLFDAVVVSCEVGHAKPDAEIYRLTLSRMGAAPPEALFVDDRADNIEAARALGLQTLHFVGDDKVDRLVATAFGNGR